MNQPVHLFLVGCLNPCLQGTNVQVGSPQLLGMRLSSPLVTRSTQGPSLDPFKYHSVEDFHINVILGFRHTLSVRAHTHKDSLSKAST